MDPNASPPPPPEGPRHAVVTPDDQGAILQISAWFLMVLMILSILVRLTIRVIVTKNRGTDDVVALISMILGVGGTVAVSLAVNAGLGTRMETLDRSQTETIEKQFYASSILYVLTLAAAKGAVLLFMMRLVVKKEHARAVKALSLVVAIWGIVSVFLVAFQCNTPRTWDILGGRCLNSTSLWAGIGAFDVLSDLVMIAISAWFLWGLQVAPTKRIVIFSTFACRIVVVAAAITRLVYLGMLNNSADWTIDSIPYVICTQAEAALAVIVASVPALKPFIDRAESGMLNASINPWATPAATRYRKSYPMQNYAKMDGQSSKGSQGGDDSNVLSSRTARTYNKPKSILHSIFRPENKTEFESVTSTRVAQDPEANRLNVESGSVESTSSDKIMIRRTTDWLVHYDQQLDQVQAASKDETPQQVIHAQTMD